MHTHTHTAITHPTHKLPRTQSYTSTSTSTHLTFTLTHTAPSCTHTATSNLHYVFWTYTHIHTCQLTYIHPLPATPNITPASPYTRANLPTYTLTYTQKYHPQQQHTCKHSTIQTQTTPRATSVAHFGTHTNMITIHKPNRPYSHTNTYSSYTHTIPIIHNQHTHNSHTTKSTRNIHYA